MDVLMSRWYGYQKTTYQSTYSLNIILLQDKEVIQPQVPLGLPCYDFTPVIDHTVVTVLPPSEKFGLN